MIASSPLDGDALAAACGSILRSTSGPTRGERTGLPLLGSEPQHLALGGVGHKLTAVQADLEPERRAFAAAFFTARAARVRAQMIARSYWRDSIALT